MWTTESLWFEIAILSMIYAFGNILMVQFEEQKPKFRRVGKYLLTLIIICAISFFFGRVISMILLALFIIYLIYVHGYYLPKKKGINDWTGEPKRNNMNFANGTRIYFQNK